MPIDEKELDACKRDGHCSGCIAERAGTCCSCGSRLPTYPRKTVD